MALPLKLLRTACQRPIVVAALKVAMIVGTILNLINQGGRLLDGVQPSWFHVFSNYLVPYLVSSYSAARNEMRHAWGGIAHLDDLPGNGPAESQPNSPADRALGSPCHDAGQHVGSLRRTRPGDLQRGANVLDLREE